MHTLLIGFQIGYHLTAEAPMTRLSIEDAETRRPSDRLWPTAAVIWPDAG